MTTSQRAAARALSAATFLFGAAPANRYAAPPIADWLAEHGAATSGAARLRLAVRYATTLALTFAFLLSRVERDGALVWVWPPLLVAAPGLLALRSLNLAASQALWLALGTGVYFAVARVPAHRLARASRVAPALVACLAAAAGWSGTGYWRLPLVRLVVAPAELAKPLLVLAVVALAAARGRARLVQGATLALAAALAASAFSGCATADGGRAAMHTDLVLLSVKDQAGVVGALVVALGVGALFVGLVRAGRAAGGAAASAASALLLVLGAETVLHVGGVVGILPCFGVPLPFVSYGGSAIVGTFGAIGVVHGLARPGLGRRDWHELAQR